MLDTSEPQCSSNADCKARGSKFANTICSRENTCVTGNASSSSGGNTDPRFACANEAPPSPDTSRQVELEIRYTDFSTGNSPSDISVRLCANTDPTCANARRSLSGDASDAGTGYVKPSNGTVTGTVEYGFEGFLEVATGTYSPTFRYTSPPLKEEHTTFDQLLLRTQEIAFFAQQLGSEYESSDHGLVFVLAQDCDRQPLSGVRFEADVEDEAMVPFYVNNSTPTTSVDRTDALGRAGFLNAPARIITFTAFMAEGDQRIGSASVLVRAGAATTVAVLPSP